MESQKKVKLALERAKEGIALIPKCERTDCQKGNDNSIFSKGKMRNGLMPKRNEKYEGPNLEKAKEGNARFPKR